MFLQGYQGMVDGGEHIVAAEWKTVSNIIQRVCTFFKIYFVYASLLYNLLLFILIMIL